MRRLALIGPHGVGQQHDRGGHIGRRYDVEAQASDGVPLWDKLDARTEVMKSNVPHRMKPPTSHQPPCTPSHASDAHKPEENYASDLNAGPKQRLGGALDEHNYR